MLITGEVPADAPYRDAQVLRINSVRVNENTIPAIGDDAVHKVVYLGDATGDGSLSGSDATLIARNVVSRDDGFTNMALTDPVIIADTTGDGSLSGQDASYVARKAVDYLVRQIPDFGPSPSEYAGVDPTVSTGGHQMGIRGTVENMAITITDDAYQLESADFHIAYTTSMLDLANADATINSELTALGWMLTKNVKIPPVSPSSACSLPATRSIRMAHSIYST